MRTDPDRVDAQPLPTRCPACSGSLHVDKLSCDACGTFVQGRFTPCRVCALDDESRRLLDLFLDARGNLKDVQRALGVSYPTTRQRMEEVFQKLDAPPPPPNAKVILARLREGEIDVDEAERLLRGGRPAR